MSYYLAPSLALLRQEVDKLWPSRSKASDGWIGDTSHQARRSDHNPDWRAPGRRRGIVRAIDITVKGIDVQRLLAHTTNDRRVAYVIYNRRIYTHARGWYKYTGSNPHTSHVHVSINHTPASESQTHAWIPGVKTGAKTKVIKTVATGKKQLKAPTYGEWPKHALYVDGKFQSLTKRALQRLLAPPKVGNYRGKIDAKIGALTVKALQRWLKKVGHYKGLIDGDLGPMTVKALQTFLRSKGHYKGLIDGKFQVLSIKGLQQYMNSQRKFYK